MKIVKIVLYMLCSLAVAFLIALLNMLSVAEGRAIGAGDFILRNVGLVSIFVALRKYIYDDKRDI